jgi:hypothetical protein
MAPLLSSSSRHSCSPSSSPLSFPVSALLPRSRSFDRDQWSSGFSLPPVPARHRASSPLRQNSGNFSAQAGRTTLVVRGLARAERDPGSTLPRPRPLFPRHVEATLEGMCASAAVNAIARRASMGGGASAAPVDRGQARPRCIESRRVTYRALRPLSAGGHAAM